MTRAKNYETFEQYQREHQALHSALSRKYGYSQRTTTCRRIDVKKGWLYLSDTYTGEFITIRLWSNIALSPLSVFDKPFIHITYKITDYA